MIIDDDGQHPKTFMYVYIYINMYSYCWMILPSDQKWSPTVKSCKVWTSILCWPRTTLPAWHGFPKCPQHCERCVRQHAMRFSAKVQRGSCWLAVMGTRSILRTTRCHGDDPRRNWGTNHHPKSSWPRGGNYAFWRRHGHAKDTLLKASQAWLKVCSWDKSSMPAFDKKQTSWRQCRVLKTYKSNLALMVSRQHFGCG